MNMRTDKMFIIGNRNLFVTRVKDDGTDIKLATSIHDALLFEEAEAITILNKITEINPSLISSMRISHLGPKIKESDASKLNSSLRSAVHFVSNHLEELADLQTLQKEWVRIDPNLWLVDKGLRGLIIHLTRININAENFPLFWNMICCKEAVCFFAVLRGVSLNLITKTQIVEAMLDRTKHINLNKLLPAVMNRVPTFAPEFRLETRKRNDKFVFSDGTNCTFDKCNLPAVDKLCWFHFIALEVGDKPCRTN